MKNPALTRWLTEPEGLATLLRQARLAAGLTGEQLATQAGAWGKSKTSRIENGTQLPSETDLEAWAKATGGDLDRWKELLHEASQRHRSWSVRLAGGQRANQRTYAELVRSSAVVWSMDREALIGELQSPEYARWVLTRSIEFFGAKHDVEQAVAARQERQGLLVIPGRRFELLIGEAALRNQLLPPAQMAEQCDLIARLAQLPQVEIGIVPFHRPLDIAPFSAFVGYDREVVLVELPSGESAFDSPEEVDIYRRVFDKTWADALTGPDANALLATVANRYREAARADT
jgi:transcriptional regulator with XRE-family HTH domain